MGIEIHVNMDNTEDNSFNTIRIMEIMCFEGFHFLCFVEKHSHSTDSKVACGSVTQFFVEYVYRLTPSC